MTINQRGQRLTLHVGGVGQELGGFWGAGAPPPRPKNQVFFWHTQLAGGVAYPSNYIVTDSFHQRDYRLSTYAHDGMRNSQISPGLHIFRVIGPK